MSDIYPVGWVAALIDSEHVTAATRAALNERLGARPVPPRYFAHEAYALLAATCARLVPPDTRAIVDIAGKIDARLAAEAGDGWRYASLPGDGEAYRAGLDSIEATARTMFAAAFVALPERQDAVLRVVQQQSPLFFEELLVEVTEAFYAHPTAQEEIGYAGMADLPGWTAIGLDQREPREPLTTAHD